MWADGVWAPGFWAPGVWRASTPVEPPPPPPVGEGVLRRLYLLPSGAGQVVWSTCTPVAEVVPGPGKVGTFDEDGAIPVQIVTDIAGKVAGVDYELALPVFAVVGKRWRTDSDGYLAIVAIEPE